MSWRTGSALFIEDFWPAIQSRMADDELRVEFTAGLLSLLVENDMDPYEVEDVHPEIRAAMRLAGIEFGDPERWADERQRS